MQHVNYLILGAGPAGLAFAHSLLARGETSFLVLEKESVAGGLCRSQEVDGAPLDIGGGHFLDVKRQEVLDLLFRFLPEAEWLRHDRIATIRLRGVEVGHPLEANLWQLPVADQVDFLESIAQAGSVRDMPMPETFDAWIAWKLGERIADEYMLPYNRKIWSTELNALGLYWLYKLPDVSFRDTLLSCLSRKPAGSLPAHGTFLYPRRHGYGEVWRRMGEALGERLLTDTPVSRVDLSRMTVNDTFTARRIVTTIPWDIWPRIADVPATIGDRMSSLRVVSVDIDYVGEDCPSPAHWIYEPDERKPYHRILCRKNFCGGARGYWTETNSLRAAEATGWRYRNDYAYPLNTIGKPDAVAEIAAWAEEREVYGLGRWGTWEHMNSDVAVAAGMALAGRLTAERAAL